MELFWIHCEPIRDCVRNHYLSLIRRESHLWRTRKTIPNCGSSCAICSPCLANDAWPTYSFTVGSNPDKLSATVLKSSVMCEKFIAVVAVCLNGSCAMRINFASIWDRPESERRSRCYFGQRAF